jgi:nucleoside-diphosphate-sugar epimerase
VEAARAAGVPRFIFVSSIAAGFPDRRGYPYAASKSEAEQIVLAAGLDTLVIRPTMVLGPGSPVLTGLRRLAGAPLGIVFGSGRVPVQPIHRDDLVDLLLGALSLDPLGGRTIEVGGPETIDLIDLLRRIRRVRTAGAGPMLHLPLGPTRALLSVLEPALFSLLPFTAGQLASFANPGVARADPLTPQMHRAGRGIDEMLSNPTRDV